MTYILTLIRQHGDRPRLPQVFTNFISQIRVGIKAIERPLTLLECGRMTSTHLESVLRIRWFELLRAAKLYLKRQASFGYVLFFKGGEYEAPSFAKVWKQLNVASIRVLGYTVFDLGCHGGPIADYPSFRYTILLFAGCTFLFRSSKCVRIFFAIQARGEKRKPTLARCALR